MRPRSGSAQDGFTSREPQKLLRDLVPAEDRHVDHLVLIRACAVFPIAKGAARIAAFVPLAALSIVSLDSQRDGLPGGCSVTAAEEPAAVGSCIHHSRG